MTDPAEPRWQVHRRPHRRMVVFASMLSVVMAAASVALINLLLVEPSPWISWPTGIVLGGLILQQVAQGAAVRIDGAGVLTYALRGKDNLVVDLHAVNAVRFVATGALQGVGLAVDPAAVTLMDRKGVSRAMLEAWHAELGTAVVLEFLTADDARQIDALRLTLNAAPAR